MKVTLSILIVLAAVVAGYFLGNLICDSFTDDRLTQSMATLLGFFIIFILGLITSLVYNILNETI